MYKELKGNGFKGHDILVLENSTKPELAFEVEETLNLGTTNIGFGGLNDFIWSKPRWREYDFVGIFNNDVYDIPLGSIKYMTRYMKPDVGMLASALSDTGTGWHHMRRKAFAGIRDVPHVETAACYFNTSLFDKLCKYIPYHYYGIIDVTLSKLYQKAGYRTVVSDDFVTSHMLAGAREAAGVKQEYLEKSAIELHAWLAKYPELETNYHEYLWQIESES